MFKKISIVITLVLLLSSCSGQRKDFNQNIIKDKEESINNIENDELEENSIKDKDYEKEESKLENTTKEITQEDAEKIFYSRYEGFNIDILKKQGQVYYIQGKNIDGSKIQKIKINIENGEIVFEKLINKG